MPRSQASKYKENDLELNGDMRWSKLFSDTMAKIPEREEMDKRDKMELQKYMTRLDCMREELEDINKQLKKDVAATPKAIRDAFP